MQIVLVTPDYPGEGAWGGIASYTYHMAHGLAAAGSSVTVLAGAGGENRDCIEDGIRVLRRLDQASPSPLSAQVSKELERLLAAGAVDVIEFPEYGALGIDFQRAHPDFPVVVKLHAGTAACFRGNLPRWKHWISRFYVPSVIKRSDHLERETACRAHVVISPSRWLLETCQSLGWRMRNGAAIVPNPFGSDSLSAQFRSPSYENLKILWLARLARLKGVSLLPAIARIVWSEIPNAEFHVIGATACDGRKDRGEWLRKQVPGAYRERMVIYGSIPYLDVLARLSDFSIAVFASRFENFPYTQLECMWAGMACVNASGTGAAELGIDGKHLLNCSRSPRQIAGCILSVLKDSDLRREIGQAAREHVVRNFDSSRIAAKMLSIYARAQQVAAQHAPAPSHTRSWSNTVFEPKISA